MLRPLALRGAARLIARSPELRVVVEWSVAMMAGRAELPGFLDWILGQGFRAWRIEPGDAALTPLPATALLTLPHSDLVLARQDPS